MSSFFEKMVGAYQWLEEKNLETHWSQKHLIFIEILEHSNYEYALVIKEH